MKDALSFLLRGALGAILGSISLALLFSLYTNYVLVFVASVMPVCLAIEGGLGVVIGLACWAAASNVRRLKVLLRIAIGTGITSVAVSGIYLFPIVNGRENLSNFSVRDGFSFAFFLLVVSLSIGGTAGLACPSQNINFLHRGLTGQRVRPYERRVWNTDDKN